MPATGDMVMAPLPWPLGENMPRSGWPLLSSDAAEFCDEEDPSPNPFDLPRRHPSLQETNENAGWILRA
jgi:hypothetical protein